MENFRSSLYDYYTGEKIKVTPLAFVAKALVGALKEFPNFNASIDTASNKIIYKKYSLRFRLFFLKLIFIILFNNTQ